jgi:hypothetical protein
MGTIQTSLLHAPTGRTDAISSKGDDMNVPLPLEYSLALPLIELQSKNWAWSYCEIKSRSVRSY